MAPHIREGYTPQNMPFTPYIGISSGVVFFFFLCLLHVGQRGVLVQGSVNMQ